ncbi:DgyrCDS1666 [Dimorphilus gyrociliatus]|uniref:DgyrCDS1666 n=1 Tax=Dimorphilus gyrociliatus TaxID=2664684 RepID=A0A7I8VAV1_9ANNE|nr:DgyrCDS1666 [Dimorphilus gyrociliatus]
MDALAEFWNDSSKTTETTAFQNVLRQQQTMEKQLSKGIFQLANTGSVIIDIEREAAKSRLVKFKVRHAEGNELFCGIQLRDPTTRDHLARRESYQYLVRKFNCHDPMVIKPSRTRKSVYDSVIIQAPDGNTIGYILPRPEHMFTVLDFSGTSLYTITANFENSLFSCYCNRNLKPISYDIKLTKINKITGKVNLLGPKNMRNGVVIRYMPQAEISHAAVLIGACVVLSTWGEAVED